MIFLKKHVRTMFLIKTFFPGVEKGVKMSTVDQENGIFHVPKRFIFIFPVKKAVERLFWTDFHISLQNLYLHNNFSQKIVHEVV